MATARRLSLFAACVLLAAAAPKPKVKNVVDCAREIQGGADLNFTVKDVSNGYARVEGAFEGFWEFALWKDAGKTIVLYVDVACGPACVSEVHAYRDDAADGGATALVEAPDVLPTAEIEKALAAARPQLPAAVRGAEVEPVTWYEVPRKGLLLTVGFVGGVDADALGFYPVVELLPEQGRFKVVRTVPVAEWKKPRKPRR